MTHLIPALIFGALIGLALGLVGGGGSILTVPILVYAIGQPVHLATTTSLAIVGANALVGVVGHARAGNVLPKTGLAFGAAGFLGAFAGTWLNRRVPGPLLLALFAVVMLVAAVAMLRKRGGDAPEAAACQRYDARGWLTLGLSGLATGFFGVGGGFVIVPALVLVLGLPMRAAVGTSLLVIALNSASGLVARLGAGGLDWGVTLLFILGGAAGVALGVRLAGRLPQRRLTQAFAGLIVLVAAYVLYRSFAGVA